MTDRATLTPADLTLLGVYRFPQQNWNLGYGAHHLALRWQGGALHAYTSAVDGNPLDLKLVEYQLPTDPPSMTVATAPLLTYLTDHGNIWAKAFANAGITAGESPTAINLGGAALGSDVPRLLVDPWRPLRRVAPALPDAELRGVQ